MGPDPRNRFSACVGDYHNYRPSYPAELIDWLLYRSSLPAGARIADVGCGTGIFTRLLADRGYRPAGLDPNREMLLQAAASGEGVFVQGAAESLAFAPGSFAMAVAAQAFHWFDIPAAISEMRRVVEPGGSAAAVWNCRSRTPFIREYNNLISRYSTEYGGGSYWHRCADEVHHAVSSWSSDRNEFSCTQTLDREGFFGRTRSSSYVKHGIERMADFEADLGDLFDRYRRDRTVTIDYRTIAIWWRFP